MTENPLATKEGIKIHVCLHYSLSIQNIHDDHVIVVVFPFLISVFIVIHRVSDSQTCNSIFVC